MSESLGRARWAVKKVGRQAFVLASRFALPRQRSEGPHVRALMYHRIRSVAREPFSVSPEDFEAQMAWLAREGLAVSMAEVEQAVTGSTPLQRKAVLVTIDDGYADVYHAALPILMRYAIPAVLFVSVADVEERDGPPPAQRAADAHVSWAELRELVRAGITIGSHAWQHRSLTQMPISEAEQEMARSRATLEQRLEVAVRGFAYPFGTRADYDAETRSALVRSGYRLAFTAQHGAIGTHVDPFTLPRIKIEGGESVGMFRRLVAGGLDGWSLVDRHLWRVQARETARP